MRIDFFNPFLSVATKGHTKPAIRWPEQEGRVKMQHTEFSVLVISQTKIFFTQGNVRCDQRKVF